MNIHIHIDRSKGLKRIRFSAILFAINIKK